MLTKYYYLEVQIVPKFYPEFLSTHIVALGNMPFSETVCQPKSFGTIHTPQTHLNYATNR